MSSESRSDRTPPAKAGDRVGKYEVLSILGQGGMGVVFRAMDLELHREVALKCPWPSHVEDPVHRKRFLREARASAKLSHPNIVPILEGFEANGLPWIAFQLVEGSDLQRALAEVGRLSPPIIARHSEEIAQALAAAHGKGILHRDITPRNILIAKDGHALLTDFGLARTVPTVESETTSSSDGSSLTDRGSIVGTPRYMSPEQALGKDVDARSDLFSLGAVIYQMCTGRYAFEGEKFGEILDAIMHREPEPIARFTYEVPAELERIVRKLLAKDPEERYQSARDLLADLRAHRRESESGSRTRPEAPASAASWMRPLAILGIGVAAVLALLLWKREPAPRPFPLGNPMQVTTSAALESEPAISPDGTRIAYSANEAGQMDIYVIDVRGGKPLRLTDHSSADTGPAWFPDGSAIAFVSKRSGQESIWRVGQMGGSATLLVPSAYDPAFSPDGRWIAFTRADSSGFDPIMVAPVEQMAMARALTGRDMPAGTGLAAHRHAAWSNDGREIAFSAWDDLWIVPLDHGTPMRLTSGGTRDREPCYSPDGRVIYFSSYREGISALWRIDRKSKVTERLTTGAGKESRPSVARDGARLVYCTHSSTADENDIVLLNRESGEEIVLSGESDDMMPALSADESFLVFCSNRQGSKYDLWKQRLERRRPAGAPDRLTDQSGNASRPAISPDGRWIAYYLIEGETRNLWTIPAEGGLPLRITDQATSDIAPSWSRDGTQLAFVSIAEQGPQVWIAEIRDGQVQSAPRQLMIGEVAPSRPTWSPDGQSIAVVRRAGQDYEAWIHPASGAGESRPLTHGAQALEVRATEKAFAVCGLWGGDQAVCRFVDPEQGTVLESEPALEFGETSPVYIFDISRDGNLVAFARDRAYGDLWVLEAERGSY
jgi:Tol biopolymer transport system component/serine/threonine protein kinase